LNQENNVELTGALFWRYMCRHLSEPMIEAMHIDIVSDDRFRAFLEDEYSKQKELEARLLTTPLPAGTIELAETTVFQRQLFSGEIEVTVQDKLESVRFWLWLLGVGLFTFGRMDVAYDVLWFSAALDAKQLDRGFSHHARRRPPLMLWQVLTALLPVPSGLHPLDNTEDFSRWLHANEDNLRWNEQTLRYEWIVSPLASATVFSPV
jgi:hypothetical protein